MGVSIGAAYLEIQDLVKNKKKRKIFLEKHKTKNLF